MKYKLINTSGMMLVVVGEDYITHRLDAGQSVDVKIITSSVRDLINRGFLKVLVIKEEQDISNKSSMGESEQVNIDNAPSSLSPKIEDRPLQTDIKSGSPKERKRKSRKDDA